MWPAEGQLSATHRPDKEKSEDGSMDMAMALGSGYTTSGSVPGDASVVLDRSIRLEDATNAPPSSTSKVDRLACSLPNLMAMEGHEHNFALAAAADEDYRRQHGDGPPPLAYFAHMESTDDSSAGAGVSPERNLSSSLNNIDRYPSSWDEGDEDLQPFFHSTARRPNRLKTLIAKHRADQDFMDSQLGLEFNDLDLSQHPTRSHLRSSQRSSSSGGDDDDSLSPDESEQVNEVKNNQLVTETELAAADRSGNDATRTIVLDHVPDVEADKNKEEHKKLALARAAAATTEEPKASALHPTLSNRQLDDADLPLHAIGHRGHPPGSRTTSTTPPSFPSPLQSAVAKRRGSDISSCCATSMASAAAAAREELRFDLMRQTKILQEALSLTRDLDSHIPLDQRRVEVRLQDVSYRVPADDLPEFLDGEDVVRTVFNPKLMRHRLKKACSNALRRATRQTSVPTRLSSSKNAAMIRESNSDAPANFNPDLTASSRPSASSASSESKQILKNINLVLKPGRMYLVLGPPGSGKTTLLRAVAGLLPDKSAKREKHPVPIQEERGPIIDGEIRYNGLRLKNEDGVVIPNAINFIDQNDFHAPRLTVQETLNFAFQCKEGGTHQIPGMDMSSEEFREMIAALDKDNARVKLTLKALGLSHVADTFVGSSEVRGVSGGQRRRVTAGEMMAYSAPIMCGDEISTGLDAATTYDIVETLSQFTRVAKMTRIVSLLQPSPETFCLFDEVIVLSEGHIIYAGPIEEAEDYFASIGYPLPPQMDIADFLLTVATAPSEGSVALFSSSNPAARPLTPEELAQHFEGSQWADRIQAALQAPHKYDWREAECCPGVLRDDVFLEEGERKQQRQSTLQPVAESVEGAPSHYSVTPTTPPPPPPPKTCGAPGEKPMIQLHTGCNAYTIRYHNSFWRSTWLNVKRHFTIWIRDRRFVMANTVKNVVMGMSVGAVFFQTDSFDSIFGVMFQSMLFIMLGAMTAAPEQLNDRIIFYRHSDANFYPTFAFVIGRALASMPQAVMDCSIFGTIIYWLVGLAPSFSNYLTFILILVVFTLSMNQMLSVCASIAPTKSAVQGMSAFIFLLLVLFCGFIVAPDVVPSYYRWLYWCNPLAWAYRAALVNEFTSDGYDYVNGSDGYTEGELILLSRGFKDSKGNAFSSAWVGYGFVYLIPFTALCVFLTGFGLDLVRWRGKEGSTAPSSSNADEKSDENGGNEQEEHDAFQIPFIPVDLTFENITYEVNLTKKKKTLKILNGVSGRFAPGRMCALMGSSGAGKTTLMDVIALRKNTGTVTGEIRLNGHLQEKRPFRRCAGYVEQFDIQSPELTVRETIMFSANLRLDRNDPSTQSDEDKSRFVDTVIDMLELRDIKGSLVGNSETGGLSFEQRKRLSIAVELAASPSVIFLDEPTSGLDSRAALLVMKSLKRIASTGRTVCATIHQPSSAVFHMFDDLLLLKRGGEVVYFGELGLNSCRLIDYFESRGARPINHGENPGTWMLEIIGSGTQKKSTDDNDDEERDVDYAELYKASDDCTRLLHAIGEIRSNAVEATRITYNKKFAVTRSQRNLLMNRRLIDIYWRSPAYNGGRMLLSGTIAFLLSSVFVNNRKPQVFTETGISSILSTIFISFIIIGVLSITLVLPIMKGIRDVFYKHRAAGMLNHKSLNVALAVAEKKFILISSMLFCVVFYFTVGLEVRITKFFWFWGFFTFNLAIYSYFGQAFMCLVRGMGTAQILASVFIGLNNFFSGLIVRPQFLTGFWSISYWITPGHYVYEGLVVSQFHDDARTVIASEGSTFYEYLGCGGEAESTLILEKGKDDDVTCQGTVQQFVDSFFGGEFREAHLFTDAVVLGVYLAVARTLTYYALKKFNYTAS